MEQTLIDPDTVGEFTWEVDRPEFGKLGPLIRGGSLTSGIETNSPTVSILNRD